MFSSEGLCLHFWEFAEEPRTLPFVHRDRTPCVRCVVFCLLHGVLFFGGGGFWRCGGGFWRCGGGVWVAVGGGGLGL